MGAPDTALDQGWDCSHGPCSAVGSVDAPAAARDVRTENLRRESQRSPQQRVACTRTGSMSSPVPGCVSRAPSVLGQSQVSPAMWPTFARSSVLSEHFRLRLPRTALSMLGQGPSYNTCLLVLTSLLSPRGRKCVPRERHIWDILFCSTQNTSFFQSRFL